MAGLVRAVVACLTLHSGNRSSHLKFFGPAHYFTIRQLLVKGWALITALYLG